MTATATLPKAMLDRFQAEIARERDEQRRDAIAELARLEAELPKLTEPLDRAIADADAAVEQARQALRDAEAACREARRLRLAGCYDVERRRDVLRSRLESELRHPAITDALAEIAAAEDDRRVLPDDDAAIYADRSRLVAWCRDARQRLLELQLAEVDPVKAVAKIMSSKP